MWSSPRLCGIKKQTLYITEVLPHDGKLQNPWMVSAYPLGSGCTSGLENHKIWSEFLACAGSPHGLALEKLLHLIFGGLVLLHHENTSSTHMAKYFTPWICSYIIQQWSSGHRASQKAPAAEEPWKNDLSISKATFRGLVAVPGPECRNPECHFLFWANTMNPCCSFIKSGALIEFLCSFLAGWCFAIVL